MLNGIRILLESAEWTYFETEDQSEKDDNDHCEHQVEHEAVLIVAKMPRRLQRVHHGVTVRNGFPTLLSKVFFLILNSGFTPYAKKN